MLELEGSTLTYAQFCKHALKANRPVIIRNAYRSGQDGEFFDMAKLRSRLNPQALMNALGPETLVPVYTTAFTATVKDAQVPGAEEPVHSPDEPDEQHASVSSTPAAAVTTPQPSRESAMGCDDDDDDGCKKEPLRSVLASWVDKRDATSNSAKAISESRVKYLKDWNLQKALEENSEIARHLRRTNASALQWAQAVMVDRMSGRHGDKLYEVPKFLGVDWMDMFCSDMKYIAPLRDADPSSDPAARHGEQLAKERPELVNPKTFGDGEGDYRFCYIGPVGSWTPLHCDVFGTYSWSFNVCGDKLWFFPSEVGNAYLHRTLPPLFPTPPDMRVLTGFTMEAVTQHPGDLVFVPSNYYHQVHNISGEAFSLTPPSAGAQGSSRGSGSGGHDVPDACAAASSAEAQLLIPLAISINHNWCNVWNIRTMTALFVAEASRVEKALPKSEMAVLCGTRDKEIWRLYADRMMHTSSNWSGSTFLRFLAMCKFNFDGGRPEMAVTKDERLLALKTLPPLIRTVHGSLAKMFD